MKLLYSLSKRALRAALFILLLVASGMVKAQEGSLHVTYWNGNENIIDFLNLGERPNGAWKEPFRFQMYNDGEENINVVLIDFLHNNNFLYMPEDIEYPFAVNNTGIDDAVDLYIFTNPEWNGTEVFNSMLAVNTDERTTHLFPISVTPYTPACPDVWEMAYNFGNVSSGFSYVGVPSQIELTTLHNVYTLPFPEIPEGYDAVYKFSVNEDMILNAEVLAGQDGKVALYTEDFKGESGPKADNNYNGSFFDRRNYSAGPVIEGLALIPGTYYLVASSTEPNFEVTMSVDDMPCPEVNNFNFNPYPSNNEEGVEPNSVTLRWDVPEYATGWRLIFGTTTQLDPSHPQTIVYPEDGSFTNEMADSYTVIHLWNNTNYFWRIDFVNDNCYDGVSTPTWNFTTHLNTPQNLRAEDESVFNDQMITLFWNAVVDRTYRTYYIYRDGVKIGETPMNNINATAYTDGPLAYNMYGYTYYVTAIYDEGESAPSNTVNVRVSGYGDVNGHVYQQDGQTGIENATVTLTGTDQFGDSHIYNLQTNSQGYYSGHIYAGSYNAQASCYAYQTSNEPVQGNPFTINYNNCTSPINFNLILNRYQINAAANLSQGGNVSGTGTYYHYDECTLIATPATGYHFVNWTEDNTIVSSSDTLEFTVTGAKNLSANFELNSYGVSAMADPIDSGTVTGIGSGTYLHGSTCTLVASSSTGYHFLNWSQNGTAVTTNDTLSFIVTQDTTFVANFEINNYEITATADPLVGGSVTGAGNYDHFDSCTLVATPTIGYHFVNWTQDGTEVANSPTYKFEVTGAAAFVANFALNSYDITATASPADAGSVTGSGTYDHGAIATLSASSATGYHFVNWTRNGQPVSSSNNYQFTVTEAADYVAHFELNRYYIGGIANPDEGGSVAGSGTYSYGAEITLTATPAEGYTFVSWVKDGQQVSTSPTLAVTVTQTEIYTANFGMNSYAVTVAAMPADGGTVTGAGSYPEGATATLAATANTGYHFLRWTLDGTEVSSEPTYGFVVNADADFVAEFELNTYEITVAASPEDAGSVTGSGTYPHGATATLAAVPNEGYDFLCWTRDGQQVSSSPVYTFTVTEAHGFVAHFQLSGYLVSASASPEDAGSVTGSGTYPHGATATLSATANAGYGFLAWLEDGEVVSCNPSYSFTVTADRTLTAFFDSDPQSQGIVILPTDYGYLSVSGTPASGQTLTVTAQPFPLHQLVSLFYFTDDPCDATDIDLTTMQFVMPDATVYLGGRFALVSLAYDVNEDGAVNVLDVVGIISYVVRNDTNHVNPDLADINLDGTVDIADAMLLNAIILGLRGDCDDLSALYGIVDGQLVIESPVALAGYEFHLTAQPSVIDMSGFSSMGAWNNGEYVLCLYSLSGEKEEGRYPVLDLNGAEINGIVLATRQGCKVNAANGLTAVDDIAGDDYAVFPVPAHDKVHVTGPGITMVEVFSVLGQRMTVVNGVNADQCELNVGNLVPGSYLVRIHTDNGVFMKNVIIVK